METKQRKKGLDLVFSWELNRIRFNIALIASFFIAWFFPMLISDDLGLSFTQEIEPMLFSYSTLIIIGILILANIIYTGIWFFNLIIFWIDPTAGWKVFEKMKYVVAFSPIGIVILWCLV